jgi:hypothetical protein
MPDSTPVLAKTDRTGAASRTIGRRLTTVMMNMLHGLASPRWMLAFFAFAIGSAVIAIHQPDWITAAWSIPLGLFSLCLLAAIATRPRFRRDPWLLAMHLALLLLVILVAVARLSYLDGVVTLNQGTTFDGQLQMAKHGPLHWGNIEKLRFANEGFVEDFSRREMWKSTYNRVRWWDTEGRSQVGEIGDDHPLLLDGYRIYTTHNRGYAPLFRWEPVTGETEIGSAQLRPGEDVDQSNLWSLPGGPQLWVMLESPEAFRLLPGRKRENLGATTLNHALVVRSGERREVIRPGGSLQFAEGRLTYLSLQTWMGYRIVYDPAMYWLAASALAVVVSLIGFYTRLLAGRPDPAGEPA